MPHIARTRRDLLGLSVIVAASLLARSTAAQSPKPRPLTAADVDDIAHIVMLEDTRQLDSAQLSRLLASSHPEVRRRAAQAVGRIDNKATFGGKAGVALLLAHPLDSDTGVAATTVFAIGQLHDSSTIGWLDSLLSSSRTPPTVLNEAAVALGKIQTPTSRAVLARFLAGAQANARTTPAIESALLSIGRMTARGDIAPIVQWTKSPNEELRWRATWALFRPKDPAAVANLLVMAKDPSALVRSWAVRGLARSQADSAGLARDAEAGLIAASRSKDRAEQTEAVTALGTYSDSASIAVLVSALASKDSWIAVAAATGLGNIKSAVTEPQLMAATKRDRPCAVRYTAQQAVQNIVPVDALVAAMDIARDSVPYCRTMAYQALARPGNIPEGSGNPTQAAIAALLDSLRAARRAELKSPSTVVQLAAIRALSTWADTTDLVALRAIQERAKRDSTPVAAAAATGIDAITRRPNATPAGAGGGGGGRGAAPSIAARPLAEYREIVERWVVPAYDGKPNPTARWETARGAIDVELYAGDAPLAVEDFVRRVASGGIIGTEFTRVVPDFVDLQASIAGATRLREEINRRGLTRGNLAWATAGLDTGSPGYTLGHTPQPHNEGSFTSLGGVIRGMDVMDRIDLGDRVLSARMLTGGPR